MRFLLVLLAGFCIWLLIERQKLQEENERAAAAAAAAAVKTREENHGNWVQDRIKGSPSMLQDKSKPSGRRSQYMGPYSVQPAPGTGR